MASVQTKETNKKIRETLMFLVFLFFVILEPSFTVTLGLRQPLYYFLESRYTTTFLFPSDPIEFVDTPSMFWISE